jgi:hypothetical protein
LREKLLLKSGSGRGERRPRCHFAEFQDAVPDISIFGEMRGCHCFPSRHYHLVKRTSTPELRIKLPAKFARPAGARVETIDDDWIDMFHE